VARPRPAGPRALRRALVAAAVLLVVAAAALGAGSWYVAGRIGQQVLAVDPAQQRLPDYDLTVESFTDGQVVLSGPRAGSGGDGRVVRTAAEWGLVWTGGTGVLTGAPTAAGGGRVRRALRVTTGAAPTPGTPAGLLLSVWPDPAVAYGRAFSDVRVPCAGGTCPAWFVPGSSGTWMVSVHGKDASRSETLRALGPALAAGMPALVIDYRGDPGAPAARGGHGWGAREWRDLEQAVDYAGAHGAQHVVLFGDSMGGAVVASFLQHSSAASRVSGVVLDAPVLDVRAVVAFGAAQQHLPAVLVSGGEQVAHWHLGVDWAALDYLPGTWLRVPALVFHGTGDDTVPIATSDRLRRAHPDLVQEVRVPGAGHVQAWNVDPAGYQAHEAAFLACVAGPQPSSTCPAR
jgi:uncharacterized protein